MKMRAVVIFGIMVVALGLSGSAFAAGPATVTLSHVIGRIAEPIDAIPLPVVGTVGNASLNALPGLDKISIPVIGNSIPIVGSLTVANAFVILQSVTILQHISVPAIPGITTVPSH
jgi:hypothetical protein